jgi:hypothetical protein
MRVREVEDEAERPRFWKLAWRHIGLMQNAKTALADASQSRPREGRALGLGRLRGGAALTLSPPHKTGD